jgi:hypothetical protein
VDDLEAAGQLAVESSVDLAWVHNHLVRGACKKNKLLPSLLK